jgi:thymidine phosphorylase
MPMTKSPPDNIAVDAEALAGALRALGMLYGASQPLAKTIAGAKSETEAIRMYIERERPHLLASYDLEALVKMVQAAREAKTDSKASVEQYSPSHKPPAKRR